MAKIELPNSLSINGYNADKAAVAKDKTVQSKVQTEHAKLGEAIKGFETAHGKVDLGFADIKGITTSSSAMEALARIEAFSKSEMKTVSSAAASVGTTADAMSKASTKVASDKATPAPGQKIASAAAQAATDASKAAAKYAKDLAAAVDTARKEIQALANKLKATEKKGAPAAAPANPKAAADAKAIAAIIKKSIAMLRTPKGAPAPIKFMLLQENKKTRIYLGPKPDAGLAKLKTQFAPKAKIKRVKDMKGQVIWEKGFLTFLSDILKGGLVKPIQIAIKEQTKLNVKIRVKRSDGTADEAGDAPDLTDDQLAADPADEAEAIAEGKAFEKRLAALKKEIDTALKGRSGAKIKDLVASVRKAGADQRFGEAAELLDELESTLEEGSVTESDGKDLNTDVDDSAAAAADKNVPPAKALFAKLVALKSKVDDAVKAGGETAKQIQDYAALAKKLADTGIAANIDKANLALSKVESLITESAKSAVGVPSTANLTAAARGWLVSRETAIKEIGVLTTAIKAAFKSEASQATAVAEAVGKLEALKGRLKTDFDNDLKAAITAKDMKAKLSTAEKARASLATLNKFVNEDELMKNLDGNEIIKSMSVVGPMKTSLKAIEKALN